MASVSALPSLRAPNFLGGALFLASVSVWHLLAVAALFWTTIDPNFYGEEVFVMIMVNVGLFCVSFTTMLVLCPGKLRQTFWGIPSTK